MNTQMKNVNARRLRMNRYLLSLSMPPIPGPFQEPECLIQKAVCPHCKRPAKCYTFDAGGHRIATWHCLQHGDIVPVRSAVVNHA
jgi:hypothetical protein